MARIPGALNPGVLALVAASLIGTLQPPARAEVVAPSSWYSAPEVGGQVFPVLRSASARWLNWRDTYGAPRMRLMEDGVWRQVGVHQGIDIFTEDGAPVVSMTSGIIERVGWTFYSGWRVGVRGNDGKYYFYAHLSSFAPGLTEGRGVAAGEMIGTVGNSGYGPEGTADEFPPHLHFGLQSQGKWENPQRLLASLYREYVSDTRSKKQQLIALRLASRRVRARAYLPGAPTPEALATVFAGLSAQASAIEATLLTKVPATRP